MRAWCLLVIASPLLAAASSVFSGTSDEEAAKALADTVDLKTLSSADLSFLIKERRWIGAAQRVLSRAQQTPLDFSAPVRSAVTHVRKELDDLIRSLDKSYGEASLVSPAFQWAQNSSHVFLQIKFAQRWNAPGALEVQNSSVHVSDCCFSFKGVGEHSMIKKEYKLMLQFLDPVLDQESSWHFAAAGRLVVTIKKKRARKWERLLRSENVHPDNMGVWQDMQAKWKAELATSDAGKRKKGKSRSEDEDEDEDEDDDAGSMCDASTFRDSKVFEFCPDAFLTDPKKTWAVLFYSPTSTSRKAQNLGTMWRVLADMVPNHNKKAAVGAVDCTRYKAFCDKKGMKQKDLPKIYKYAAGATDGVAFSGEPALEDLVAWAAGAGGEL